jgi:hypothetical protein
LTRVLSSHSSKSATSSVVEIIIAYLFSICAIHILQLKIQMLTPKNIRTPILID